jgi:hypothetical protein
MSGNGIKFGCIDTSTGQVQDGYIDNEGQMKFKKPSFWSRFLDAITPEPREKEFLGTKTIRKRFMGIGNWREIQACVYREFNPINGKTHKIWFEHGGEKRNFNKDAYEATGELVLE